MKKKPDREPICRACPQLQEHVYGPTCGTPIIGGLLDPDACGCLLEIKWLLPGAHCPQGKWPGDPAMRPVSPPGKCCGG